ncbi:hypothetical protein PGIGA_G00209440 [Pangasianodon gigas]|uniref:Uncharacterized protein n=1 Tax=Pangasianodon gigas TaxID=30993 RepID=A0ACC5WFV4_PANGG|nr:hypothetical protein [Pangasianodon gigas]
MMDISLHQSEKRVLSLPHAIIQSAREDETRARAFPPLLLEGSSCSALAVSSNRVGEGESHVCGCEEPPSSSVAHQRSV